MELDSCCASRRGQFDRQGQIQDALFQETAALRTIFESTPGSGSNGALAGSTLTSCLRTARTGSTGLVASSRTTLTPADERELLAVLHERSQALLATAFNDDLDDDVRSTRALLALLRTLEEGAGQGAPASVRLVGDAIDRLVGARAQRLSATSAELPPVQRITQRVISAVLLLGFVLVDLGSPTLEAVLFSTVSGCFYLIGSFLDEIFY